MNTPHIYIKNARIVDAPPSSGAKFYVEHPENDAILASAQSREQAEQIVQDFNELAEKIEVYIKQVRERLEYLRKEIKAERISYGELAELQSLAKYIEPGDVELLEAAGVPEFTE